MTRFCPVSKSVHSIRFVHVAELLQTSALPLMLFDVTLEYLKAKARSAFGWVYPSLDLLDKLFTSTARKCAWRR